MALHLSERLKGALPFYSLKIKDLYASMDAAYAGAAQYHGFRCGGCLESCCEERFYHYTLAEHLYLTEGMASLDADAASEILLRAEDGVSAYRLHDLRGSSPEKVLCPLNFAGLCRLYKYRPMICRLHGIPHRVRRPDGSEQTGPGCRRFYEEIGTAGPVGPVLDRTEYYSAMAALEIELRRLAGFSGRIRKTVAQMVLEMPGTNG